MDKRPIISQIRSSHKGVSDKVEIIYIYSDSGKTFQELAEEAFVQSLRIGGTYV